MSDPIDITTRERASSGETTPAPREEPAGVPSNPVYARVGDQVLRAAQEKVRRGLPPQDIVREIVTEYDVRLNVGELRLLLASRRIPE